MKFSTGISVLSIAGGVLATNHIAEVKAGGYEAAAPHEAPPMVHEASPIAHEVSSIVHEATSIAHEVPAAVYESAAPTMVHTAVAPPPAHTTAAPPPAHEGGASVEAAAHTITVGGDGNKYDPPEIQANVGDTVHFIFLATNHTVSQSTFDLPCKVKSGGVDSGFMPNAANVSESAPTFEYIVTEKEPTWWYCKQGTHCEGGMVFAINPTEEKSFAKFQETAKLLGKDGVEGKDAPANGTAAAAPPPAGVTLTVDNGKAPPAATTSAAQAVATGSMVAGWNAQGNAQACNCACFCGVGSFPSGDGIGAYGGYAGSLPAPWG